MLRAALLSLFTLIGGAAAAQPLIDATIRRCVEDGSVTYTDRDCGPRAVAVASVDVARGPVLASLVSPAVPASDDPAAALAPGMPFREALALLGRPYETTVHWRRRVLTETWTWRRGGRNINVTFRDGRVADR